MHVFAVDGPLLDAGTYVGFRDDLARLRDEWARPERPLPGGGTVGAGGAAAVEWLTVRWAGSKTCATPSTDRHGDFWRLLTVTDEAVDRLLGIRDAQEGPYRHHPLKPALWREMLLGLGHAALVDRHGELTGDVRQQVAVLDGSAIRPVERFANPCAPLPKPPRSRSGRSRSPDADC